MATKTKNMREITRAAVDWPTPQELADDYGVSHRFVRSMIQRELVEVMKVDCIRVNPESWERFLQARHRPGQY